MSLEDVTIFTDFRVEMFERLFDQLYKMFTHPLMLFVLGVWFVGTLIYYIVTEYERRS